MDDKTYEQYELSAEMVDDAWKYLKEGMPCSMVLFNGNPITMTPPNHVELKVEYCEPGVKGDTATNVTKPVKVETGAEFLCPAFINMGNVVKIDTRTGEERYIGRIPHGVGSGQLYVATVFDQRVKPGQLPFDVEIAAVELEPAAAGGEENQTGRLADINGASVERQRASAAE